MQKLLESSVAVRMLTAFFRWVGVKWRSSRIITWFLTPVYGLKASETSIFTRLFRSVHLILCSFFEKTHLNRLFEGSVFKQSFLWCLLPALLAPVLPTMVILALAAVGVFSLILRAGCSRSEKLTYTPVNKFILLFAAIYIISTLTSVTISGSLFTGLLATFFTLFALFFNQSITSKRQLDLAVKLLAAVGTVISLYGIYQYFNYSPESAGMWLDNEMFSEISKRVYSTLENPNVLAEYLLLVTPLAFACVLTAKTWPKRILFLICTGIMLLCMLFTSSRGGWLGLIFAAAIFLIMLDARFILVGLIGLVLLYFALPDWAIQRFSSIGDMSDSSTSYRVYIWYGTIAMLKDYWFSGIGPGTAAFNLVYPAYGYNTIAAPHAHNLFLQLMCDSGILGLVLFLMILFSYFRTAFTSLSSSRDKSARIYLIAAVSAICGFLLQSMTDYSFYNNRVMLMFWVVIGLGAAMARRNSMKEGHPLWSES